LVATKPARRSTVTDAAALLVETVRARTGAELEVVDEGRVTDPSLTDANLIHVGVNGSVRELLRPHWGCARHELRGAGILRNHGEGRSIARYGDASFDAWPSTATAAGAW
jgi:hypothetical protein